MAIALTMEFHEVANLFPLMGDEEYQNLVSDIRAHGLREPLWTYQGKIIDGRNRYKACCHLGIEPVCREWDEQGSLVTFVVSLNLQRRHLTSSQRAMLALEIEKHVAKEAEERTGGRPKLNEEKVPTVLSEVSWKRESAHQAASVVGTSGTYVKEAKKIEKKSPELKEAVLNGTLTIPQAKRQLKEQEREQKRDENRQEIARAQTIEEALKTAKFSTILIDPPWDWEDEGDVDQFGRATPTYGTMSIGDLLALPVDAYADTNCHLYLWITNRSLPKGFQLMEKWGFRYVTCLTWAKPSFGMGNYFRGQTEHLLFGVKGSQELKRHDVGTIFTAPRGPRGHSSKPIEAYELIESCSPGPYLELFARSERADWTSWGAEV